jgi:hypothetical protein
MYRRLSDAASEWARSGPEPSFLLTGSRLEQFDSWASTTSIALGPLMQPFFEDTPALILFHGRTVLHVASDGSATVVSQHGTMQDACGVVA